MSDILSRAVVFAVDFKPRIVGGLSVMPNHGKAGGAPTWLRLGDGSTASTIPVPLAGYGASFTGTQYVDTGVVDRYDLGSKFWMYFYSSLRVGGFGWMTRDAATPNVTGIGLFTNSTKLSLALAGTSGVDLVDASPAVLGYPLTSFAVNFDGTASASGVSYFFDGKLVASNIILDTWGGTSLKTGRSFLWGRYWNGASIAGSSFVGNTVAIAFGDGLLTPRDVGTLDTLVRGGIR